MLSNEQLKQMSKDQLILHIAELYKELESLQTVKKSKAGVVTVGSPTIVKHYIKTMKTQLHEGGGE